MPRVTYPLLSKYARGRLGKDLIYYGEGYVRSWSVQNDPRTVAQLEFRTIVGSLMRLLKMSSGLDRAWLRRNFAKSWHTKLVSFLTAGQMSKYRELLSVWQFMSAQERAEWDAQVPAG